jgi:hypothetical protein
MPTTEVQPTSIDALSFVRIGAVVTAAAVIPSVVADSWSALTS